MSQNLDKNKVRNSIQRERPQELPYVVANPADKDSNKNAIAEIDKFIGKSSCEFMLIRK